MATFTFVHVNNSPVAIPDAGAGNVPSLITQSLNVFVGGTIEDLNVSIIGLSHTWASDLDIALFGPNAQNNLVLMSDAVGSGDFTGFPLTFDDSATSGLPDFASPISNGSYRPTNHGISSGNINPDETGAQFGLPSVTLNNPGPTGGATLATAFNGANTAGAWTLGISDDGVDDTGSFFNWSLQIQTAGTTTVINGTGGADSLAIASTSATAGDIAFNGAVAGFTGLDTIYFYTGGGADDVTGGQGAETVYDGDALDGDSFNGGAGFDTLDYSNVSFVAAGYSTVFFDLDTGNALSDTNAFDTILNFENLIASDTDDTIDGTFGANYLSGLAGNDDLSGLDGEDILNGGVGNDELTGGLDQDAVFGGIGNDVLWLRDAFDNVAGEVLDGGEDFDTIQTTAIGAYSFDLRDDSLLSIEALRLQTDPGSLGEIGIRAAQINGTELATNLQVTGSTDATVTDRLTIDMTGQVALDLYNFVMINFDGANDRVIVLASNGPAVAITGTGVADELHGSNNSFDYLFGGNGNDSLYGEAGNDELDGGLGADAFFGGAGDEDWASYSYESEDLVINLSNSALNVGAVAAGDTYLGIEGLIGGSGDDSITGDAAVNYLLGNDGNDTLTGGAGADSIFGGVSGTRDMASYADSGIGLRVDLQVAATNTGIAAGDVFNDIEDLFGSAFSDSLLGDTGANMIWGDLGNDAYLDGRVGNDTIYGGTGNDVMIGGWGADVLDGGAGTRDRVQYTDSAVGLRADIQVATFNTGIALGDVYTGIEDIYGSFHGDTLLGDSGANIIWGDAGNDAWLDGRIGTDTLYGGAGNDVLIGGAGADVLDGGAGTRDRVQYTDSAVGLRADLQVTTFNTGVAMGDTYVGIEDIFGGFQNDTLLGDGGGNMIWGSAGNDLIDGRLGDDTLIGGAGNDTLVGGAGVDVFLFETALGATNRDSITGYSVADDTIQLENAIFTALAATGPLAGTAFVSGTAATTAAHRIIYNSANGQLLYDADGNGAGAAVHFATLTAGLGMAAGEFVVV